MIHKKWLLVLQKSALKPVQQTVTEGINDLTVGNKDEKKNQEAKTSNSTPSKKPATTATAAAKQKGAKQISIRGIPLVKLII